jgi:hypothetical protein
MRRYNEIVLSRRKIIGFSLIFGLLFGFFVAYGLITKQALAPRSVAMTETANYSLRKDDSPKLYWFYTGLYILLSATCFFSITQVPSDSELERLMQARRKGIKKPWFTKND